MFLLLGKKKKGKAYLGVRTNEEQATSLFFTKTKLLILDPNIKK